MREHSQIRAILPQRHPLLLVDRVLRIERDRSIRAVKAITGTEPCYAGLPEGAEQWRYRYPYSLLLESFGQAAALLWLAGHPSTADGRVLMFASATDVHFEGDAWPGDVLRHEVRLDSVIADTAFASGETWAGDQRVATVGTLVAALRRAPPAASRPLPDGPLPDGPLSLGRMR